MKEVIIDVREPDEIHAESIEGAVRMPLSHFETIAPGTLSHFMDRKIILMCRSGARARLALEKAKSFGFNPTGGYEIYEGGILRWKKEGKPTQSSKKVHLPILRQTHLIAGGLGLIGVLLGYFMHPGFYWIAAFITAGLTFAGASGTCLMSNLLALAPWNKTVPNIEKEVCVAGTGQPNCENA